MKYRITRHNEHNWAIQEWQDGGQVITRGPHNTAATGELTKAKWMQPERFYPRVEHAANGLLELLVKDEMGKHSEESCARIENLIGAVTDAQAIVLAEVTRLFGAGTRPTDWTEPKIECGDACCEHAADCDGHCDHDIKNHTNACNAKETEEAAS